MGLFGLLLVETLEIIVLFQKEDSLVVQRGTLEPQWLCVNFTPLIWDDLHLFCILVVSSVKRVNNSSYPRGFWKE